MTLKSSLYFAFVFILLGALLDFVFNGVFKIIWFVVYAPAYVAACKFVETKLTDTHHEAHSRLAVISLLGGALITHLMFTGYHAQTTYTMKVALFNPITLHSNAWPQKLVVSSDRLSKQLAGSASGSVPEVKPEIQIVISRIVDYGCTRTFTVESVAGIDVHWDPDARWTWKTDPSTTMQSSSSSSSGSTGPGNEDQQLPWCWFKFYRQ